MIALCTGPKGWKKATIAAARRDRWRAYPKRIGCRAALANSPDVTTIELPGLNHLFQTAKTGAVGEYADIQETVAPTTLATMSDWLTKRFVKR